MELFLHECGDGGDLVQTDGFDLKTDGTLFSAIYISLFGGKAYYNLFDEDNTEDIDFEEALRCEISVNNLNNIASIAAHKLQWLIDDGVCSNIETSATAGDIENTITVTVLTESDEKTTKYSLLWDRQKAELKSLKEIQ